MKKPHKLPCEQVIEENIGLVKAIASRFYVSDFDKEDLIQVGMYGLWKAAYHFDETKGVKFSTYCIKYVLGEMKKELKNMQVVKVSRKYYKIINELRNNENICEEEIMSRLGCTRYDISFAYNLFNSVRITDENMIMDNRTCEKELSKKEKLIEMVKNLKEKRLKQNEIAKRLNISQSTVSRILSKACEE